MAAKHVIFLFIKWNELLEVISKHFGNSKIHDDTTQLLFWGMFPIFWTPSIKRKELFQTGGEKERWFMTDRILMSCTTRSLHPLVFYVRMFSFLETANIRWSLPPKHEPHVIIYYVITVCCLFLLSYKTSKFTDFKNTWKNDSFFLLFCLTALWRSCCNTTRAKFLSTWLQRPKFTFSWTFSKCHFVLF